MSIRIEGIERVFSLVTRLPQGAHFSIESKGGKPHLEMQASGDVATARRALFPGVWKKKFQEGCQWWEYQQTTADGVDLKIYADRVGPKSCKRIEEEVTKTVHVPACLAHDEVQTQTVVRWECPEEEAVDGP